MSALDELKKKFYDLNDETSTALDWAIVRLTKIEELKNVNFIEDAAAELAALRARVEALEKFFNEVEWSGDQNAHVCPDCGNKKSQGHRPSCRYRTLREA